MADEWKEKCGDLNIKLLIKEAENKRLRNLIKEMPTCNLQFENRLAMDKWNDWKAKYFTPKGRIRKALKENE
jgi:hypothetical protein